MFKGYDVRGVYGKEVDEAKFRVLGRAMAQFGGEIAVGMDYREHNETLATAFAEGFASAATGKNEIAFLGRATTPCVAYCAKRLGASVTASHNPPEYNGLKPFRERRCFYGEDLAQLQAYYAQEEKIRSEGKKRGKLKEDADAKRAYANSLPEFKKAVYDLGGGAACAFASPAASPSASLFPKNAVTLFSEPDPFFAKRAPEPTDSSLGALKAETLKRCMLGFAFDGDADRIVAVDEGKTIDGCALGAFYANRFMKKGDVVALTIDVSDEVCAWFSENGFKLEYSAVGDINVTRKAQEARAAFSMEKSGHYAVTKHLLYSDGLYFAALLSSARPGEIAEFASQFTHKTVTEKIAGRVNFRDLEKLFRTKNPVALETVDGVKARFDDYCALVRASQTEPVVRVNVEAPDEKKARKGLEAALALAKKALVQN